MSTTIATEPAPLPEGGPWVHVVSMYGLCEVVGEALQGWPFLLEEVAKRVGEEVPQALHGPELGQTIQDQLPERVTRQRERAKRYGLGPRDQEVTGRIDGKWVDAVINLDTREVRPLQEVTTS